jgi:pSer/pThr/pTyr-binding forkhead associated (FHA) protein
VTSEPTNRLPVAVIETDNRRIEVPGSRAVIGRSDDADCVLPDPNISRRHAELRRSADGQWEIVDMKSTNGIKVNGRRLPSSSLRDGDQVTLGTTTFRFVLER